MPVSAKLCLNAAAAALFIAAANSCAYAQKMTPEPPAARAMGAMAQAGETMHSTFLRLGMVVPQEAFD